MALLDIYHITWAVLFEVAFPRLHSLSLLRH